MPILASALALALIAADGPGAGQAPVPVAGPSSGTPTAHVPGEFRAGVAVDGPRSLGVPGGLNGTIAAQAPWSLTLPEAIRIGLENSQIVRVISTGNAAGPLPPAGIVIAHVDPGASTWQFKADLMAHVRSIEQQYWALSCQTIALWGRETAVRIGEEILKRERAELESSRGGRADVAEVEQQLENFKLNLVTATSDVITTERQLRNLLGLPATDDRRIVPATAPLEARFEPGWEESVAAMNASQPDLAIQRRLVEIAEFKAMLEGDNPTLPPERREASKLSLEKQQAACRQALHSATHSLARGYLMVDAGYNQFRTAQRLRAASQQRLEAQRAFQAEGRVTIDRLLDAVGQYANAIAQEAEYRSIYNTSIAAFEETKGTLLATDKITVAEGPSPRKADRGPADPKLAPASFEGPTKTTPAAAGVRASPTLYKLKASFGGSKLLEVEVEVGPTSPPARDR